MKDFQRSETLKNIATTIYHATAVGSQYYLTTLTEQLNLTSKNIQEETNIKGEYYIHYTGGEKYKTPFVPIITTKRTLV